MMHMELLERTAWLLSMIASFLDAPIVDARYRGVSTKGAIPMDIVFTSTTQLAAAIRAGHVSAIGVLQAHLEQIGAYNPCADYVANPFQDQEVNSHEEDSIATHLMRECKERAYLLYTHQRLIRQF
jgi:hypothetical protein